MKFMPKTIKSRSLSHTLMNIVIEVFSVIWCVLFDRSRSYLKSFSLMNSSHSMIILWFPRMKFRLGAIQDFVFFPLSTMGVCFKKTDKKYHIRVLQHEYSSHRELVSKLAIGI